MKDKQLRYRFGELLDELYRSKLIKPTCLTWPHETVSGTWPTRLDKIEERLKINEDITSVVVDKMEKLSDGVGRNADWFHLGIDGIRKLEDRLMDTKNKITAILEYLELELEESSGCKYTAKEKGKSK